MLTVKEVEFLREELATAKNPLFFYDGDGDGLASFLLLYRIHREGKGIALRGSQRKEEHTILKVKELQPDKVFILDVPYLSQEMIDEIKCPIFWIDHHEAISRRGVHYYNPRIEDPAAYIPTSRMCWQISTRPQDIWIAALGSLADFHLPDFLDEFIAQYPYYLPRRYKLPTMLFKKKVGLLVKLLFFIQKGSQSDVYKSIKILTRIESPDEIFKETTSGGTFLLKRFEKINSMYEQLLHQAKKSVTRSRLLLFYYTEDVWSFTTNLANELTALYPKKVVIIARKKSDCVICSIRGENVIRLVTEALEGTKGSGGGHPAACGAVIPAENWDRFLLQFTGAMKKHNTRA